MSRISIKKKSPSPMRCSNSLTERTSTSTGKPKSIASRTSITRSWTFFPLTNTNKSTSESGVGFPYAYDPNNIIRSGENRSAISRAASRMSRMFTMANPDGSHKSLGSQSLPVVRVAPQPLITANTPRCFKVSKRRPSVPKPCLPSLPRHPILCQTRIQLTRINRPINPCVPNPIGQPPESERAP